MTASAPRRCSGVTTTEWAFSDKSGDFVRNRPKSSDIVLYRHRWRPAFRTPSGWRRTSDSEGYNSSVHSMQPMPWSKSPTDDAALWKTTCRKTRFVKLFPLFLLCTTYSISPISVQSTSEVGKWVSAGRRSAGWAALPGLMAIPNSIKKPANTMKHSDSTHYQYYHIYQIHYYINYVFFNYHISIFT